MPSDRYPTSAKRYKPAVDVRSAHILEHQPAFIKRRKSRGRFAVGVRYERQVQDYLALLALGIPGVEYMASPWIEFLDRHGKRWCQPDGLLIERNHKAAIIYEVKYQHCADAWWQLTHLYEPVIRKILPGYTTARIEVVHWHDPAVEFPERYDLTDSPFRVPHASKVAVFIFNPRRRGAYGVAPGGHNGCESDGQAASRSRVPEGAQ